MKPYGKDPKQPNYARPEYVESEGELTLIADEMGGTKAMHARSTEYIRKWSGEKKENYKIRRLCESFFEGFGRTLSAAVGMLFAKPPAIEWNEAEAIATEHWDNIDGVGTKGTVFAKRFSEATTRDGLALILVDHPSPPKDEKGKPVEVTGELEERLALRPRWAMYDRMAAINWFHEEIDNRLTLTRLVLYEPATERDGAYGVKPVHRYRVLELVESAEGRLAKWTLYRMNTEPGQATAETFTEEDSGEFTNKSGERASFLPVSIGYAGRTDTPMQAAPPLLGVAYANLSHWQLSTSLRFNSEVAGFAQPTVIGELATDATGNPVPFEIGPLVLVHLAEGGEFKWSEPEGTGLDRLANLVLEKLRQIGALGVSFLMSDTRAAETAEAKRLDASAENATLATAAQGIEDALNMAWAHHAWFLGVENAPVITISRDFESTALASDIMRAYVDGLNAGLPPRILLEAWQQGGRIPEDADLDQIEMEMMAQIEAKETERREREEELAMAGAVEE